MTLNENGIVLMVCDNAALEAPVPFCKCATCVEARRIHRAKLATIVSPTCSDEVLANIRRAEMLKGKARGKAWRAAKKAEAEAKKSEGFSNRIKFHN